MILTTILALTLLFALILGIVFVAVGGAAFIAVFADVIVCGVFIGLLIRFLIKRKKK